MLLQFHQNKILLFFFSFFDFFCLKNIENSCICKPKYTKNDRIDRFYRFQNLCTWNFYRKLFRTYVLKLDHQRVRVPIYFCKQAIQKCKEDFLNFRKLIQVLKITLFCLTQVLHLKWTTTLLKLVPFRNSTSNFCLIESYPTYHSWLTQNANEK